MNKAIEQALADIAAGLAVPAATAAGLGPGVVALIAAVIREAPELIDEIERVIGAYKKATSSAPAGNQTALDFKDQSAALDAKLHAKK